MCLKVLHISVLVLNCFTLYYDQFHTDIPYPKEIVTSYPLKGRLAFLTFWSFIFQIIYFFVALLNDCFGTNTAAPRRNFSLRGFKDLLFSIAFLFAIFVTTAFWILHCIDKRLLFSEEIENALPVWLNHTIHTFVTVFIGLEMLLSNITYPNRTLGLTLTLTISIVYLTFLYRVYFTTNVWIYPIFGKFNWPQHAAFTVFCSVMAPLVYLSGEKLIDVLSTSKSKLL